MRILVLSIALAFIGFVSGDTPTPTSAQLSDFASSTTGPIGTLTTSSGCPVSFRDVSSGLNSDLIRNEYFVDSITHLVTERIPERMAHAKGNGAFGYFEVTHDVTDLTKAKFLSEVGKQTKVAVRFSTTIPSRGGSDLGGAVRGYAAKFYTEEGIWDMTGMHNPVFAIRDSIKFSSLSHSIKRNPATDLTDFNLGWDFITQNPESFFSFFLSISPYGKPDGNQRTRGHSIHTLQLANSKNETNFARFYFYPDLEVRNLTRNSTTDLDYYGRYLYDDIGNGTFPSWTVYVQPLSVQDALDARANGIDVFDITRILPQDTYPLRQIGKLILNENPKNYFAEVEQMAFCPGNVVPGIVGAPDSAFAARAFAYRAAAIHRLGVNFKKIPVNRPTNRVLTYNRDGSEPNLDNEGGAPNYYPNSFNGPVPEPDHQPPLYKWEELVSSNADQIKQFYESLNEFDKQESVFAIVSSFTGVADSLIAKVFDLLRSIDQDLHDRVYSSYNASRSS